jgi:hypothetical protein
MAMRFSQPPPGRRPLEKGQIEPRRSEERPVRRGRRRLYWFAALYLGSLLTFALIVYGLRLLLKAVFS